MKKYLALLLMCVLCLSCVQALAETPYSYMNYYNQTDNEASIDWLEDAHAKAPAEVSKFYKNDEKTYIPNPLLDDYPEKTAVVYRSAGYYGCQCAGNNNTSIMVFVDKKFASTDEAYACLKELGLVEIIDGVIGSVTLVTPIDAEAGFGEADFESYNKLHDAIYQMKTSQRTEDGQTLTHADAEYFGTKGKIYFIGIGGGATFINNYIAPGQYDRIGQVSGLLLLGGEMNEAVEISNYVPAYLVNGTDTALAAWRKVNGTDTYAEDGGKEVFVKESAPLRRVISVKDDAPVAAAYVKDAFFSLFAQAQRESVISTFGGGSASLPEYQEYVASPEIARYALVPRNTIYHGVTLDGGLSVKFENSEIFAEDKTMYDQYLQRWYEVLPASVLDGTAPEHSVPMILALHGTGDDPLMYIDEIGLLELAGREGLAIVAPFEEELVIAHEGARVMMGVPIYEGKLTTVFPKLIDYMLEKYPALDPARVYATGYSLGGGSTYRAIYGGLEKIAAAVPMAGMHPDMIYPSTPEEDARLDEVDMPTMVLTSTYDLGFMRGEVNRLTDSTLYTVDLFLKANNIPVVDYDFAAYPWVGVPSDRMSIRLINGEWRTFRWEMDNEAGIPMVAVACTENLGHALYAGYADIAWSWMKNYSRDLETGAVVYAPAAK